MRAGSYVIAMSAVILGSALFAAEATAGRASIGSCGKVISKPGSFVATSNLTVKKKDQDCITVKSSFVTIDLQGFTIDCATIGNDGVNIFGPSGLKAIVIRNGTIINCFNGIDASVVSEALIDGIVAIGNSSFGVAVGAGSTVKDSIAADNKNGGIFATCPGNIFDNTATSNAGPDLKLEGAGCSTENNATTP